MEKPPAHPTHHKGKEAKKIILKKIVFLFLKLQEVSKNARILCQQLISAHRHTRLFISRTRVSHYMNIQSFSSTKKSGTSALFLLLAIAAGALVLLSSFTISSLPEENTFVRPSLPPIAIASSPSQANFVVCNSPAPSTPWSSQWQFGICNGDAVNASKAVCMAEAVTECTADCQAQVDAANASGQLASDCNQWCRNNNPPGSNCTGVVEASVTNECAVNTTSGGSHGAPWECTAQGTWEALCKCS